MKDVTNYLMMCYKCHKISIMNDSFRFESRKECSHGRICYMIYQEINISKYHQT